MIKQLIIVFLLLPFYSVIAQDTFSIVALDSATGEVGSAGASCVDLFRTSLDNDDFIGVLFPGKGAINSQASYIPTNQDNATNQMNLGKTPSEIISWLVDNDVQNRPEVRQYGIAALVDGKPQVAAHTGSETMDYTGHIIGSDHSIQGNILKGKEVLDSMESKFQNASGDLACRLMAALQGANMVGADSRCSTNGTSALFAYVKVAQPSDAFGDPSFLVSVRTKDGDRIEPIDTLQKLFDAAHNCVVGVQEVKEPEIHIYPNPGSDELHIDGMKREVDHYSITGIDGRVAVTGRLQSGKRIDISGLEHGIYFLRLECDSKYYTRKFIKN